MKNFAFLCRVMFALSTLGLLISCSNSSDGGSKTKVRYVVHTDSQMVTSIMYRNAAGEMTEGLTENIIDWEKDVNVDAPFSANLVVAFFNASNMNSQYYLAIYVGNETVPSGYVPGVVPAYSTTTGTAALEV